MTSCDLFSGRKGFGLMRFVFDAGFLGLKLSSSQYTTTRQACYTQTKGENVLI